MWTTVCLFSLHFFRRQNSSSKKDIWRLRSTHDIVYLFFINLARKNLTESHLFDACEQKNHGVAKNLLRSYYARYLHYDHYHSEFISATISFSHHQGLRKEKQLNCAWEWTCCIATEKGVEKWCFSPLWFRFKKISVTNSKDCIGNYFNRAKLVPRYVNSKYTMKARQADTQYKMYTDCTAQVGTSRN